MNEYVFNKENLIPQIKFLEPDFDNCIRRSKKDAGALKGGHSAS